MDGRRRHARCRGIAAVELAVCLPLLVLIIFASIEACTMIFLKETLTVAAFEGGRAALSPTATASSVTAKCQTILTDRNVQGATIQVTPDDITLLAAGGDIAIQISAPCEANAVMPVWFYGGTSIDASSHVMKEF